MTRPRGQNQGNILLHMMRLMTFGRRRCFLCCYLRYLTSIFPGMSTSRLFPLSTKISCNATTTTTAEISHSVSRRRPFTKVRLSVRFSRPSSCVRCATRGPSPRKEVAQIISVRFTQPMTRDSALALEAVTVQSIFADVRTPKKRTFIRVRELCTLALSEGQITWSLSLKHLFLLLYLLSRKAKCHMHSPFFLLARGFLFICKFKSHSKNGVCDFKIWVAQHGE